MSRNRLASVASAVAVLKAFTSTSPEWGVSDLSAAVGQSRSSVHRILSTLTDEGLLEQDSRSGRYRLGLALFDLAAAVPSQRSLHEAVLLPMTDLRNKSGETVQVGVLDGRQVVYVERLDSPNTLRLFTQLGRRNDAHCTGTGKVLLAFLPKTELERLLRGWTPPRQTEHTIVGRTALTAELTLVRTNGFAENRQESEVGVVSIAAPIRDDTGSTIAAMSVAGPADRMDQRRDQLADAVVTLALATSRRLGYRGRR
ncbi:IclR family transcriptional regulator [Ilumatobacter sp.]|uniref:IclR family transcriptional regulator n=1 Tax=Ilumatobacter sp. TaxID=1967498 RepID=UPI003B5213C8